MSSVKSQQYNNLNNSNYSDNSNTSHNSNKNKSKSKDLIYSDELSDYSDQNDHSDNNNDFVNNNKIKKSEDLKIPDTTKDEKIKELLDIMQGKHVKKEEKKNKDSNAIHYDDVEFDKLEENERKALKDLFTGMPDIYKITGTSPEDSQNTINKKCAEKLKMYHPDRHSELVKKLPEEKRAKELKKLDIQFKLLRDADSILRDPAKRKYYDLQKKTTQSKNFVAQKQSFEDFINLQKSKITDQSKALAQNDYKMASLTLDKKHGFDRHKFEESALTKEETDRRFSELMDSRELDAIEFTPKQKFDDSRPWDPDSFNKMFVKNKFKDNNKKSKREGDKSIIAWEDVSAVNDFGINGTNNYVSIDNNYEDLYTNNNFNDTSIYASKLDSDSDKSISDSEKDSDIDDIDMDEHDGYKYNKDNVDAKYEEMLNRRTLENTSYDNREMHDKNSWKSVLDNPFSISSSMGTVLGGQDFSKLEGPKQKKVINKQYADVYKSLVYDTNDVDDIVDTNETNDVNNTKSKHKKRKVKKDNKE